MTPSVIPHDDVSYTGEETGNAFNSLSYYRDKANQFQSLLNALDSARSGVIDLLSSSASAKLDVDTAEYLSDWLDEFDNKRSQLLTTAEAVNAGAALINSLGGRMPQISIPGVLGSPALAIPAAAIAWVAAAAMLTTWGYMAITGLNQRLAAAQLLDAQTTPEEKAELAKSQLRINNATQLINANPWSSIGELVKWGAILALGFIGWKAFKELN